MIYCYPIIKGEKSRESFFENWNEVPVNTFVEWNRIAALIDELNNQIIPLYKELYDLADEYHILKLKNPKLKKLKKMKAQIRQKDNNLVPLVDKRHNLELEAVALFCSIPIDVLAEMPFKVKELNENGEMIDVEINDNHFQAYKNRLSLLVNKPLPADKVNFFYFQSKTDTEIQALELMLKSMRWWQRFSKARKELKKEIKQAKQAKFVIKDIWLQTTLANKEFQNIANRIVQQFESGDFSELIYLIAMLTVESNEENDLLTQLREEKSSQTYVERYRDKFLAIYKDRVKLFTEQENVIDIATLVRIANFFLPRWRILRKTSQKS